MTHELIDAVGAALEIAGVGLLVGGVLFAFVRSLRAANRYARLRHDIGRAILLGLEVLVAADIVLSVTLAPTMDGLTVLATLVAGILTWYMVSPELALASLTAFFISELADWAIYSFTRRPLQTRILVSSLVAVPLDTVTFQYLAQYLSPAAFSTEVASKMVGVLIVWYLLRARAQTLKLS